jgi:16S rRNA U1498 N3-methylase RsmE
VCLIGPEAGLAATEYKLLRDEKYDWIPIAFGDGTLRIEVAAVAATALLSNATTMQ